MVHSKWHANWLKCSWECPNTTEKQLQFCLCGVWINVRQCLYIMCIHYLPAVHLLRQKERQCHLHYHLNLLPPHLPPEIHDINRCLILNHRSYYDGTKCWQNTYKCTLVQALRLCTGCTAHRGSTGIALPFHDRGTRRGWWVSIMPRPLFTPGKDPVPIVQEAGWAPGPVWTGADNLAPTGIRSPDRPARGQSLYRLCYLTH